MRGTQFTNIPFIIFTWCLAVFKHQRLTECCHTARHFINKCYLQHCLHFLHLTQNLTHVICSIAQPLLTATQRLIFPFTNMSNTREVQVSQWNCMCMTATMQQCHHLIYTFHFFMLLE
jgi:hypothetical protein